MMFASLFAFYALYSSFDNWTFTRFLLPALPLVIVLAAVTAVAAWAPVVVADPCLRLDPGARRQPGRIQGA